MPSRPSVIITIGISNTMPIASSVSRTNWMYSLARSWTLN